MALSLAIVIYVGLSSLVVSSVPSKASPTPLESTAPVLHPRFPSGSGDVDGPFEYNGVFHLFKCCDYYHLTAPTAAGPWKQVGASIGGGYISGSATVVNGTPRIVAAHNCGNNKQCCDGPPSDHKWKYPCVANPPTAACYQDYRMALPLNLSDPDLFSWQQFDDHKLLVNYTDGESEHGWVQQDPSRGWQDSKGRWFFLGGTSVNGSLTNPAGVPIIELFGSRSGADWSQGFEYLGIFSNHGLAMCDPELIPLPDDLYALYVCTRQYVIGTLAATASGGFELVPLEHMPHGGLLWESGATFAAKGFQHEKSGRYLMWSNFRGSSQQSFTLAREVTYDSDLQILLSYPARELAHLRAQTPQIDLRSATLTAAQHALADAAGGLQLDVEATFSWADRALPVGGRVGISAFGGSLSVDVCIVNETLARLGSGSSCDGGMTLPIKPGESALTLRIILDGSLLEAFAQGGRASWAGHLPEKVKPGTSVALLADAAAGVLIDMKMWSLSYSETATMVI